jgi:nuclear pore complex protein Nup98-Nup96
MVCQRIKLTHLWVCAGGTALNHQPGGFGVSTSPSLFNTQQQTGSAFTQPANTGASLFGQAPSTGFTLTQSSASPFGPAASLPSLFSGTTTPQSSLFGQQSTGSLFGQGGFGAAGQKPAGSGLFGTTGSALFGSSAAGGGLFGNTGSSLFAQSQQQQASQQSTGLLFGRGAQSSSSLFYSQPAGGGLFSSGPAPNSLFNTQASGGSLFGGTTSGGMFGPQSGVGGATGSPSLFGIPGGGVSGGGLFTTAASSAAPFGTSTFAISGSAMPAVAPAAAAVAPSPVSPGQIVPYGALPAIPQLKSMGSVSAMGRAGEAVDVLFRPSPGVRGGSLARAHRHNGTPPSLDVEATKKQFARRSPSIFKTMFRDSGFVIATPLPSTQTSTSPPAEAGPSSPIARMVHPTHRASPTNGAFQRRAAPAADPVKPVPAGPSSSSGRPETQLSAGNGASGSPGRSPSSRSTMPQRLSPHVMPPVPLPSVPDELYIKPSISELQGLCSACPNAIKAIHGFTVGKEGVGEIMFLKPVDLSEVADLGSICNFHAGAVSMFDDLDEIAKPAVGSGLNCPARVRLWLDKPFLDKLIKKRDKVDPEEQVARLRSKLQAVCIEENATFVSSNMSSENAIEWIFEVPHWSRCVSCCCILCLLRGALTLSSSLSTHALVSRFPVQDVECRRPAKRERRMHHVHVYVACFLHCYPL